MHGELQRGTPDKRPGAVGHVARCPAVHSLSFLSHRAAGRPSHSAYLNLRSPTCTLNRHTGDRAVILPTGPLGCLTLLT